MTLVTESGWMNQSKLARHEPPRSLVRNSDLGIASSALRQLSRHGPERQRCLIFAFRDGVISVQSERPVAVAV